MTTLNENNSAPVMPVPTAAPTKIHLVGDLAQRAVCSVSWVKVITDELRIETMRLTNNARVYTDGQAAAVIAEIHRRRMEALK